MVDYLFTGDVIDNAAEDVGEWEWRGVLVGHRGPASWPIETPAASPNSSGMIAHLAQSDLSLGGAVVSCPTDRI